MSVSILSVAEGGGVNKAKGFTAANYHGKLRRWREAEEERQRSNRKSSGDRLSRVLFSAQVRK